LTRVRRKFDRRDLLTDLPCRPLDRWIADDDLK